MCKYLYERVEPCIQRYIYLDVFLLGEAIYICKYRVFIFSTGFLSVSFSTIEEDQKWKRTKTKNGLILFCFFHFLIRVDLCYK